MRNRGTTLAEALIAAPCWVCFVVCAFGNIVIWLIIPEYLSGSRPGEITDGMLAGGYAGVQPWIALLFNFAMVILFLFSLYECFVMRKMRG